jgi:hypothetical protein
VRAALGELEAAEAELTAAAAAREPELVFIGARSAYLSLRGRPVFDALRARVGA